MRGFLKRANKNKIVLAILAGALIISLGVYLGLRQNRGFSSSECSAPSEALVTKVIDGDTIVIEDGSHVRLIGVDADERQNKCYKEAKQYLKKLISGKKVKLKKDEEGVDQYGRCLRYVFYEGENVSVKLAKRGLAESYPYEPNLKYRDQIIEAENYAKDHSIGCEWSDKKEDEKDRKKKQKEVEWLRITQAKLGRPVIDPCRAGQYLGKKVIVQGEVVGAYRDPESGNLFLNFRDFYPNQCFTAVVFSSNVKKFADQPEDYYNGRLVRVEGRVKQYKNKPEIILDSSSQIEVGK